MSLMVWKGSARSMARTVTPRFRESPYVSSDSTLRHASALSDWLWSGLKCFGAIPIRALLMRLKAVERGG
jgi:hypothetical protein